MFINRAFENLTENIIKKETGLNDTIVHVLLLHQYLTINFILIYQFKRIQFNEERE